MLKQLGGAGVLGFLVLLAGIGVLAYVNPIIGAGVALVVAGLGLVTYGMVTNMMRALGMGM